MEEKDRRKARKGPEKKANTFFSPGAKSPSGAVITNVSIVSRGLRRKQGFLLETISLGTKGPQDSRRGPIVRCSLRLWSPTICVASTPVFTGFSACPPALIVSTSRARC